MTWHWEELWDALTGAIDRAWSPSAGVQLGPLDVEAVDHLPAVAVSWASTPTDEGSGFTTQAWRHEVWVQALWPAPAATVQFLEDQVAALFREVTPLRARWEVEAFSVSPWFLRGEPDACGVVIGLYITPIEWR